MFGYVRPLRSQLEPEALERYQAAYCGLCHSLKGRCGLGARFVLNYDFVFLYLLLDPGPCPEPVCRRCVAHPWKPRPCLEGGAAMELCACQSVILAWYKLLDGVADEGFWKGTGYRLAAAALARAYKKARRACPDFDRHTRACLEELGALEKANSPQLDRVADAFARLLAAAAPETGDPAADRPRQQLLYHLGRWIYLADGVDDLAGDREKGRYNPVAARFGDEADMDYLATTMSHSLTLAQSAYQLLAPNGWNDILENILYLGLPNVQRLVLEGRWNKKEAKSGSKSI